MSENRESLQSQTNLTRERNISQSRETLNTQLRLNRLERGNVNLLTEEEEETNDNIRKVKLIADNLKKLLLITFSYFLLFLFLYINIDYQVPNIVIFLPILLLDIILFAGAVRSIKNK